jgi:hypothetical protein
MDLSFRTEPSRLTFGPAIDDSSCLVPPTEKKSSFATAAPTLEVDLHFSSSTLLLLSYRSGGILL